MTDYDIYVYTGDVQRSGHLDITNCIRQRKENHGLRKNALLCLSTYGGDPDAGYRIGRALQHNYESTTVYIVGPCKSAGTLIAISAHRLIIGDMGELGPLDIQLKKSDEIGEMSSGLAIMTALDALKERSISAFSTYLVKIRYGNQISTKMSADIAAQLTKAFIEPMAAQIDPIRLGEHQRAMNIAISYGERLSQKSKNLKGEAIYKLIASYPSHGFVIDRKEARSLFERVESPDQDNIWLYDLFCEKVNTGEIPVSGRPRVLDLTDFTTSKGPDNDDEEQKSGNGDSERDAELPTGARKPTRKRSRAVPKRDAAEARPLPDPEPEPDAL